MAVAFRTYNSPVDGDHKRPHSNAQAAAQKLSRDRRFAEAAWRGTFLKEKQIPEHDVARAPASLAHGC